MFTFINNSNFIYVVYYFRICAGLDMYVRRRRNDTKKKVCKKYTSKSELRDTCNHIECYLRANVDLLTYLLLSHKHNMFLTVYK